ncbi:MAG TPA: class I SAM-dependent methyltransferase [Candidatus Sulfotelmatobacter sp.]|jgi:ubiquinone/menaquinone biosynthesis C-methylase UbiE
MSAANDQYALGRSPHEYARLARQAEIMKPMTRRLFADAGIGPGMTVLDLGSGAGDVAMLLAEMVGPQGKVIGLDLDHDAMRHARERALAARFDNLSFVHSDFAHYRPDAPLDAMVGRFVLMYQADPAAALEPLAKHLRPGGIAAFIEPWFRPLDGPDSVTKTAINCLIETFRRCGAHVDLGPRMHRVFQAAGLPVPEMRFEAMMDGHEDSPLYQYIADTMESLLPKALECGVPGADTLDIASLPSQVRAEMKAAGYAITVASIVRVWCRTSKAGISENSRMN